MGSWDSTLSWKADEELELTVNVAQNLFSFKNVTTDKTVSFNVNSDVNLADNSW